MRCGRPTAMAGPDAYVGWMAAPSTVRSCSSNMCGSLEEGRRSGGTGLAALGHAGALELTQMLAALVGGAAALPRLGPRQHSGARGLHHRGVFGVDRVEIGLDVKDRRPLVPR